MSKYKVTFDRFTFHPLDKPEVLPAGLVSHENGVAGVWFKSSGYHNADTIEAAEAAKESWQKQEGVVNLKIEKL